MLFFERYASGIAVSHQDVWGFELEEEKLLGGSDVNSAGALDGDGVASIRK